MLGEPLPLDPPLNNPTYIIVYADMIRQSPRRTEDSDSEVSTSTTRRSVSHWAWPTKNRSTVDTCTLPETNSSHLKIGQDPIGK